MYMRSKSLSVRPSIDCSELQEWSIQFGLPRTEDIPANFNRFHSTYQFTSPGLIPGSNILYVGSQWLHQALMYIFQGHILTCVELDVINSASDIREAADRLFVNLLSYRDVGHQEFVDEMPTKKFELVLISETVALKSWKLTRFWDQILSSMKVGGRLVIVTPNSSYFESIYQKENELIDEELGEEGIPSFFDLALREQKAIHFTIHELIRDLSRFSEKLKVMRYEIKSPNSSLASEKARALQLKLSAGPHEQNEFFAQINHLEKRGENPFGSHIYLDLMLTE